ncbi:MAG: SEL1-like repeat protein [Bacteroidales bacterium]|nr:SEL1-like repeat protein [Bacteroidales bacterium]
MSKQRIFIYNPSEKPKNQLIAEFVIRKDVFEKLYKEVKKASKETPPQHYLIAGQRGMGKTTLLLRIQYAIEDDLALSKYLIPIRFSEEQYNIGRLERLWEETALMLEHKIPDYVGLYDEMLKHEDKDDYERICFETLANKLKERKQRVLLMIDNIGDLFDRFPEIQNHRLREVLMTCPSIQIIGSSSRVLEHTFHYDKPFFEFFHEVKLNPITKQNSIDLLRALGEANGQIDLINEIIKNTPERIEVLRRVTGGVPRTTVLLYEIFVDHNNGNAFEDLQLLLDGVNSLYKHRMDELKPQQQQIIDALARAWEPISAADVLEQSKLYRDGLQSNQISAQLKQLTDNQVVEMVEGVGRKKTYRIRERFFNIWYLMRHGRKQSREEVLWLIKFLTAWCSGKELNDMITKQIECMRSGTYSENAAYYKTLALSDIDGVEEYKKITLISETAKFLKSKNRVDRVNNLEKLIESKGTDSIVNSALELLKISEYEQAESLLLKASSQGDIGSMFNLGLLYEMMNKDYKKAEEYYLKAIEHGDINSMYNLARLNQEVKKDYENTEKYYLMAAEHGHDFSLNNLALFYYEIKHDFKKAEVFFLKAIENNNVNSIYNLALFYKNNNDYEKAEKYYLKAIEHGDSESMYNIGLFYDEIKKDYIKAEEYYLKSFDHGELKSINNLARLYLSVKKDYEKAEEYLLKGIYSNPDDYVVLYNLVIINLVKHDTSKIVFWSEKLLEIEEFYKYSERVLNLLGILLIEKQYHFLLKHFQKENSLLMKSAKPYYYALAYFLRDELPGEYEKAGGEIKETVDEIIQKHKVAEK